MDENLHKEHRDRVRKEFLANGFDIDTPPHKILEMLLFYAIPRKDTNELAHKLLNEFGSLSAVFDATVPRLLKVDGIGESSAALIKLISPILRVYIADKKNVKKVNTFDELGQFIQARHFAYNKEVFCVTSINAAGAIIAFDKICEGDIASVGVPLRDILETVIARKASAVVISHNHPTGNAIPSRKDLEATKTIAKALANIGVKILDHIIAIPDDYVSLAQSKQFKMYLES